MIFSLNITFIFVHGFMCQVYQKRDLLLAIFNSAFPSRDDICEMCDEKVGEELYKSLKGKRYLIIMDDIWNSEPWDDLKLNFPNDSNGSRILFTTRHENIWFGAAVPSSTVGDHDCELGLKIVVSSVVVEWQQCCPLELMEIGKQIAKKCEGLPLANVVISGLLAKQDKTLELWKHVAESIHSYTVSDPEQYMHTLELSYNVLPRYLKACFLYLGAFMEDYEIPVWKLIWLWAAEGFICQNEQKTLEEVAEDYLINLMDRSLVIVSKKSSSGEIKAFYVHDLLRDLCI
ncbi:putative late blight resistance protein homolog R1B-16 [Cornus florida]|uniref:putative late blight resistance protein homolog R1B-16 n=1 Tax=Cornus florida TaxID=4283 RepID=UPI0028A191D3|nr:putative late blight resistance protein homolog R1B-16 [Cornus florida]